MSVDDQILSLLQQQNKPFNLQSISDWLAQYGFKKPQIQRSLDALVEGGKVVVKVTSTYQPNWSSAYWLVRCVKPMDLQEFGKTKIFLAPQKQNKVLPPEVLADNGEW
jgi:Fe2+ or Zn2+ uptake regulation protein